MMDASLARRLWRYDPATGSLTWLVVERPGKVRVGDVAGTRDSYGYTVIRYGGVGYKAHRLAWLITHGVWPVQMVDHIDRDRSNNRLSNLREATPSLNSENSERKRGRSGTKYVTWFSQYGKWKVSFKRNGASRFVGYFQTVEEAIIARDSALMAVDQLPTAESNAIHGH